MATAQHCVHRTSVGESLALVENYRPALGRIGKVIRYLTPEQALLSTVV